MAFGALLSSGARTTAQSSGDLTVDPRYGGLQVILDVTTYGGAGSLTPKIEGKDPASGKYYALHAAATAVVANGTTVYEIGPGSAASGGITQRTIGALPRTIRVSIAVGDATSHVYSVGITPVS